MAEIFVRPNHPIISRSDLKGKVTYVNEEFLKITGFTREEVMGKPHNIIRHPDTPKEIFKDLWHTLQSGQTWRGIVKNKTKHGDYYWVLANVTPFKRDGQVVGYESVRIAVDRHQVAKGEEIYKKVRSGHIQFKKKKNFFARFPFMYRIFAMMIVSNLFVAGAAFSPSHLYQAVFFGAFALMSLFWGWWEIQFMEKPMQSIAHELEKLAQGDLTADFKSHKHNELTPVFEYAEVTRLSLLAMIAEIHNEIDHSLRITEKGEQQITYMSQSLAKQKQNEENVNAAGLDLRHHIEHIQSLSQQTQERAAQSMDVTYQNQEKIQQEQHHLSLIEEQMDRVKQEMSELKVSIDKASRFMISINDIVNKTNFLSINAAIEAAKSGEAGRGFAIVAEEVKTLSEKTKETASDIGDIFQSMINNAKKTEESILMMENLEHQIKSDSSEVFHETQQCYSLAEQTKSATQETHQAIRNQFMDYEKIIQRIEEMEKEDAHLREIGSTVQEEFSILKQRVLFLDQLRERFRMT